MLATMDNDGNGTVEIEEFYVFFKKAKGFKEMQTAAQRTLQVQKGSAAFSLVAAVVFFGLSALDPVFIFGGVLMLLVFLAFVLMAYGVQLLVRFVQDVLFR